MVPGGLAQDHPLQNRPQMAVAALQVKLHISLAIIKEAALYGSRRGNAMQLPVETSPDLLSDSTSVQLNSHKTQVLLGKIKKQCRIRPRA